MSRMYSDVFIGDFRLDAQHRMLISGHGKQQKLTWKTLSVLLCLHNKRDALVTREALIEEVWEGNFPVGDKALATAIWNLRKVFQDSNVVIETIPKKGYRLSVVETQQPHGFEINQVQQEKPQSMPMAQAFNTNKRLSACCLLLFVLLAWFGYSKVFESQTNSKDIALLVTTHGERNNRHVSDFVAEVQAKISQTQGHSLISESNKQKMITQHDHLAYARQQHWFAVVYVEISQIDHNKVNLSIKNHLLAQDSFFMNSWQVKPEELQQLLPQIMANLRLETWQ